MATRKSLGSAKKPKLAKAAKTKSLGKVKAGRVLSVSRKF